MELTEYAVATIDHIEPALSWWVLHLLRKHMRIITAMSKRYYKWTNKFGTIPKNGERSTQAGQDDQKHAMMRCDPEGNADSSDCFQDKAMTIQLQHYNF